jgi:hypothetical protein
MTTSDTDADQSVVQAVIVHCAGFPRSTLGCVRTTLTHRLAGAVLAVLAGCGVLAAASGWAQAADDLLPPDHELALAEADGLGEGGPDRLGLDQPDPVAVGHGLADLDGLGEPEAGAFDGGAEVVGDADADGVAVGDGLGDAVACSGSHDWLVPAGA